MTTRPVRQEATGWRDAAISQRHKLYGWDAPFCDLDFAGIEYDNGRCVALIEYKSQGAKVPSFSHPTYRALTSLANNSHIPFFVVFYNRQTWHYRVHPVNAIARQFVSVVTVMVEREYVVLLYRLRNRAVPQDILLKANGA